MPFRLEFFVLLATVLTLQVIADSNISILITLPLHPTNGPSLSWERGFEILPGALQAVDDINNDSSFLSGHSLKLLVVDSGRDEYKIIQHFVNLTFYQEVNIVGLGGILDSKAILTLLPLVEYKGVLLSAITHTDKLNRILVDYDDAFLSLPPPSAMASVLLNFIKSRRWKNIGLVTDTKDAYFFSVAEKLQQMAELNDDIIISPYVEYTHAASGINNVIKSKVKIIVTSLSAEASIRLLCAVHERGLLWPQYAWLLHSFQAKDFFSIEQLSVCDIEDVINGVFFIDVQPQLDSVQLQAELPSGFKYDIAFGINGYAKLLYDLVWAMAIILNTNFYQNDSYMPQADPVASTKEILESYQGNGSWNFKVFHIRNLKQVLISTMQFSNSSITASSLDLNVLENAPNGELPTIAQYPPLSYTVLLGLQIALTIAFVTVILVLYVTFRKEPEVKATSYTLSFLMFAGCYFNLVYLCLLFYANHTLHLVDVSRDNAVCIGIQWLSGPGISLPIMLATLLVKMLRIYHIFHNTKLRLGRYCSDLALALYVLLILLPDILVNLIWTTVDPYQLFLEHQRRGSYINLVKTCKSTYQTLFFGALCIYLLILVLALAVVAIITRKVRLQHFKDTKKVNILSFILGVGIVITFSCWLLVQTLDTKRYIAALTVHIPHSVVIISFQSLLFVPKVFPPLWRLFKNTFSL
jgi:hypothetical protein